MAMSSLILQHPEWNDGDYDVLADGVVVGRIMKASAAPEGTPWLWTLIFGYHEDRTPTHRSGRNSTYRLVQISATGSMVGSSAICPSELA
jgi:hypothetical protein